VGYLNRNNIDGAVALFAPHDYVVTDRLHAHVLSGLMGKPHVVLDNNYKKVSTIYNDYTGSFETAHFATDLVEAQEIARKAGRG
jgi:pyruvyl transferase EpsO